MAFRFQIKSEFTRNVATMVTGTVIAQLIPLLISPILTRIYSPEDFGAYAIYFSLLMILSVASTGKYEMAIVLPKEDSDAKKLLQLSLIIAAGVAFLSLLLLIATFLLLQTNSYEITQYSVLLLLPISIFLVGSSQALHYYYNRRGDYKNLAGGRIARSIGYSFAAILAGLIKSSGISLAIGDIVGYISNNIFLIKREKKNTSLMGPVGLKGLQSVARRYSNFPKYLIVSGFFEKAAAHSPILLLTKLFQSTAAAGYFSLAQRIIVTPADLVARAISDVFREKASAQFAAQKNCKELFIQTFKKLVAIGLVPFIVAYFVVVDAFAFIFSEDWYIAGQYAQLMMPMFFMQFLVSPLSIMFLIAEKQKYDLIMQVFLFVGVTLSFAIGRFIYNDTVVGIKLFTLTYCIKYVVEFFLAYSFSRGGK